MNMPHISSVIPQDEDKFCRDDEGRKQRADILARQKANTFFSGIQQTFMFISGPLVGAGLGMALPWITGSAQRAATLAKNALEAAQLDPASTERLLEQLSSAVGSTAQNAALASEAGMLGVGLIAAAAVASGIAIVAHHFSANIYFAAGFDQSEVQAQHIAKYVGKAISKELDSAHNKAPVMVFDNPEAQRNDGKSWADHLNMQQAANQNRQMSV